ncbi:hypothetical protein E2C01_018266 [Portunus trituberculatus]|uniref:Uncharacterized protein n=1 Tax=Portunus trituberculatus TaxID=210409 RepID=A0A5B7DWC8_PORTR|nr:hypothetical protein [Portunus trituberculatus]
MRLAMAGGTEANRVLVYGCGGLDHHLVIVSGGGSGGVSGEWEKCAVSVCDVMRCLAVWLQRIWSPPLLVMVVVARLFFIGGAKLLSLCNSRFCEEFEGELQITMLGCCAHHIHVLQYEGAGVIGVVQIVSAQRGVVGVTEVEPEMYLDDCGEEKGSTSWALRLREAGVEASLEC